MKYVRSFDPDTIAPGQAGPWLLAPEEGAGCALRLRRGGGATPPASSPTVERYLLVLAGEVGLETGGAMSTAGPGDLIVEPPGAATVISAPSGAVWMEMEAQPRETSGEAWPARVIALDPERFEGGGFAYQSLVDRSLGAMALRMNALQVQPGSGSPDFHIHAFAQIYVIQEGEMTVDVGRSRLRAPQNSVVCLPPGVVHRNFNASGGVERHISLLVPEPADGEIFDYAVTIHDREAEIMTSLPD